MNGASLFRPSKKRFFLGVSFFLLFLLGGGIFYQKSFLMAADLRARYEARESVMIFDRHGELIAVQPNEDGYFAVYMEEMPNDFFALIIEKEDRFFFSHLGVNPVSTFSAGISYLFGGSPRPSSTITQQLAKILLGNEKERTIKNKIREMAFAFALELHFSKEEILKMYGNSIFLGNRTQGFESASRLYFNRSVSNLSRKQQMRLLATISSPSNTHPFSPLNTKEAQKWTSFFGEEMTISPFSAATVDARKKAFRKWTKSETLFEVHSFFPRFSKNTVLTIDEEINRDIRKIVQKNTKAMSGRNAKHAAVVVLSFPKNEIIALIGSPDPRSEQSGFQLNMTRQPRPVGSTIKPFLYAKAFERGVRGYSLVDDREQKFETAEGFAFYPKNYDYKYRGIVSVHFALSNSLNVPTVTILNFLGPKKFFAFLREKFFFTPLQNEDSYQLGVALGGLEMSVLRLAHLFSVFAQRGEGKPLFLEKNTPIFSASKRVFPEEIVQLITKILRDRKTGVSQFGLKSNLNTPFSEIALKTGTSREFHDSWTVGFSPDILVAVWVGNAENTPMDGVSGQMGAGKIWAETMELLMNSSYNHNTTFREDKIISFFDGKKREYGLLGDDVARQKMLLITEESLIISPHNGDIFRFEENMKIPFHAQKEVSWFWGDTFLGKGTRLFFTPPSAGQFLIRAEEASGEKEKREIILRR